MKGCEIEYRSLEMADYLLPFNNKLTIEEKRNLFAVRNKMINIQCNFSSKCEVKCECGEKESMKHIYECKLYNNNRKMTIPYEKCRKGGKIQAISVTLELVRSSFWGFFNFEVIFHSWVVFIF